jgi:hypothetical protein
MARQRKTPAGADPKLLIKDAAKLLPAPSRRLFLRGATSLGALAVLSGCDIIDGETSERALRVISTFNDRVQALLFNPNVLAPEYPENMITRPFPFNGYYSEDEAPEIDGEQYHLEIGGRVENKKPWVLADLYKLPELSQTTRLVCVEGWSAIGFGGRFSSAVPDRNIDMVQAGTTAKRSATVTATAHPSVLMQAKRATLLGCALFPCRARQASFGGPPHCIRRASLSR